jgi:hypothetical protein
MAFSPFVGLHRVALWQFRCARQQFRRADGRAVSGAADRGKLGSARIHVRTRQAYDDTQVRTWNSCRHLCCGVCLRGLLDQAYALGAAFRAGDTVIFLEQEPGVVVDAGVHGLGRRYITVQVFKVDEVHARMIAPGAREASAPKTGGTTARISIVLDPDGNWIELQQRASIVGTLT